MTPSMQLDKDDVLSLLKEATNLENGIKVKVLKKATREAAKTTLRAVRKIARRRRATGAMSKGYKIKAIRRGRGFRIMSPTRSDLVKRGGHLSGGYYPAVHEYGSRKRNIQPLKQMRDGFDRTEHQAFNSAVEKARSEIASL